MKKNLCVLDLITLRTMYERESEQLQQALLSGTAWEETREQRQAVTELAIALHQKRYATSNPAESTGRHQ